MATRWSIIPGQKSERVCISDVAQSISSPIACTALVIDSPVANITQPVIVTSTPVRVAWCDASDSEYESSDDEPQQQPVLTIPIADTPPLPPQSEVSRYHRHHSKPNGSHLPSGCNNPKVEDSRSRTPKVKSSRSRRDYLIHQIAILQGNISDQVMLLKEKDDEKESLRIQIATLTGANRALCDHHHLKPFR